jgi:hypothetical protein
MQFQESPLFPGCQMLKNSHIVVIILSLCTTPVTKMLQNTKFKKNRQMAGKPGCSPPPLTSRHSPEVRKDVFVVSK